MESKIVLFVDNVFLLVSLNSYEI